MRDSREYNKKKGEHNVAFMWLTICVHAPYVCSNVPSTSRRFILSYAISPAISQSLYQKCCLIYVYVWINRFRFCFHLICNRMPWNDPVLLFGHAADADVLSLVVPGCTQQQLLPPFVPLFDVFVTPKNNRFIFDTVRFFLTQPLININWDKKKSEWNK